VPLRGQSTMGAPSWEEDRQVRKATRSCPTARARKDATDPLTVHRAWIQGEYAKNGGFLVLGYGPFPQHTNTRKPIAKRWSRL